MGIFDNLDPVLIDRQRFDASLAFKKAGGLFSFVVGPTYAEGKTHEARWLLRTVAGGQPSRRAFLAAFLDHCREQGHEPSEPKQDRKDPKAIFVVVRLPRLNG